MMSILNKLVVLSAAFVIFVLFALLLSKFEFKIKKFIYRHPEAADVIRYILITTSIVVGARMVFHIFAEESLLSSLLIGAIFGLSFLGAFVFYPVFYTMLSESLRYKREQTRMERLRKRVDSWTEPE